MFSVCVCVCLQYEINHSTPSKEQWLTETCLCPRTVLRSHSQNSQLKTLVTQPLEFSFPF